MSNFISRSLTRKIITAATLGTFLIIALTFFGVKKIGEITLYTAEVEKANFMAETVSQLLSINLYLGLDDNVIQLAQQLYANQHVLAVTVNDNSRTIISLPIAPLASSTDTFDIRHKILAPQSDKVIGELRMHYSSLYYLEALKQYRQTAIAAIGAMIFIMLVLALYFHKLLSPLATIRNLLRQYDPEAPFHLPFTQRSDEIGLISNAFNQMHTKVQEYTQLQHDINNKLEVKVAEKTKELSYRLYHDPLTNLPNRMALIEALQNNEIQGGLLIVNIDDFKEVNDFFGQKIGDTLLLAFADLLLSQMQDGCCHVYRLHGDEFAIYLNRTMNGTSIIAFAYQLTQSIDAMPFEHEGTEISVSATVGMTLQMDSALEKADIALKLAKKQGRALLLYDEHYSIEQQYRKNIIWVRKLKDAIEQDQLIPFFQPIYDNNTETIVSYESLIRLREKDGNIVPPGQFLDVIKKAKLTDKLTRIVIEKSCQKFADFHTSFSVNLDFEDISNKATVAFIKERVLHYGVANRIIFEILETEGNNDYESISSFIGQMHSMGCKVAIDDFGSGYSNFERLMKLHVDFIKIDGSLIRNIDHDVHARIIVQTIVDFARKLGVKTIAEFVHDEVVYTTVKELNIDRSQGFFLAEPSPYLVENS